MEVNPQSENKEIENLLGDIRENTKNSAWKSLYNGLFYGGGVVLGTLCGVVLIGWILSLFGIMPGFEEIAKSTQTMLENRFR